MRFLSLKVLQLDLSSNVVQTRDVNKGERKESILFPFLSNKGHLFPPDQTPKYTPCVPSHHFPSFPPTHSSGSILQGTCEVFKQLLRPTRNFEASSLSSL